MKCMFILLLVQVSVQLHCDKTMHQATIGSTITVVCSYKTSQFRFSKKYWCAGDVRSSCEVLMDTDGFFNVDYRTRGQIIDAVSRGLIVHVTDLQLDDTGNYWVGIDKIYADIMLKIQVVVRNEAVMKPNVWPLSSLEKTCEGEPVTFRCRSERGTNVLYTWYGVGHPDDVFQHHDTDMNFHCSDIAENAQFFCSASNDVSKQNSELLTVQQTSKQDCLYLITSKTLSEYDCIRSTTLSSTTKTTQTSQNLWSSATTQEGQNQTIFVNQTQSFSWSGLPLWYEYLRWILSSAMFSVVFLVHIWTKSRPRRFQGKNHKNI